uniref:Mitochondrial folate transporter/carrier n=1 Tax=Mesocestoides corti TaxID=53468 RepID=A0A5K3EG87_MESCO
MFLSAFSFFSLRPRSSRFSGTLLEIYRARGFFGFYQGVTPNLLGNAVSWGLYFFLYGALKNYAQGGDPSKKLSIACYFGYSSMSGIAILWMTNPIWVAKTRMCLQYETLDAPGRLTTWGTLRSIWLTEGLRGLYRGMVPGMVGVSNGALQFLFYEEFRNFYNSFHGRPIDTHLNVPEYLLMGTLSKTLAVAATYPYQVVRTRLQEQHRNYGTMTNLVKTIFRYEGVFGFYKGLLPNILRTAPACGLTFVVYENCYKCLKAL